MKKQKKGRWYPKRASYEDPPGALAAHASRSVQSVSSAELMESNNRAIFLLLQSSATKASGSVQIEKKEGKAPALGKRKWEGGQERQHRCNSDEG
jgi:hypothetical protein